MVFTSTLPARPHLLSPFLGFLTHLNNMLPIQRISKLVADAKSNSGGAEGEGLESRESGFYAGRGDWDQPHCTLTL